MGRIAADRVVLGIDPGVTNTGYGVVARRGQRMVALDGGAIVTSTDLPLERRLALIHSRVEGLLREHEPDAVSVEDIFYGRNVRTAFAVGQARGVVLLAAAQHGVPCSSFTPQQVKNAVCGSGAADKAQVQRMVGMLLELSSPPEPDHAADALAIGICEAGGVRPMVAVPA